MAQLDPLTLGLDGASSGRLAERISGSSAARLPPSGSSEGVAIPAHAVAQRPVPPVPAPAQLMAHRPLLSSSSSLAPRRLARPLSFFLNTSSPPTWTQPPLRPLCPLPRTQLGEQESSQDLQLGTAPSSSPTHAGPASPLPPFPPALPAEPVAPSHPSPSTGRSWAHTPKSWLKNSALSAAVSTELLVFHLCIHPCICAPLHPSTHTSMHASVHTHIHPTIHPCTNASLHPCTHPSTHPSM